MERSVAPVSVVIPCYCCSETIERAFRSVVEQTLAPAEILLIDDASPDDGKTRSRLHDLQDEFADRVKVKLIELGNNGGPSVARNAGWEAAGQPFIAFLDADDAWHPRKLEIQTSWMRSNPDVALSGHFSLVKRDGGSAGKIPPEWSARPIKATELLRFNRFPTRSVMLRRDLPYRFDVGMRYSEDYGLWLDMVTDGHAAWLIELPLAYSYKADYGAAGLAANLWRMEAGELQIYRRLASRGRISRTRALALMAFSLFKYFRRKLLVLIHRR